MVSSEETKTGECYQLPQTGEEEQGQEEDEGEVEDGGPGVYLYTGAGGDVVVPVTCRTGLPGVWPTGAGAGGW